MSLQSLPINTRFAGPVRRVALVGALAGGLLLALAGSSEAATETLGKAGGLKYVRAEATVPATVGTRAGGFAVADCGAAWTATGGGAALVGDAGVSFLSEIRLVDHLVEAGAWHAVQPERMLSAYGICSRRAAVANDVHTGNFAPAPSTLGFGFSCAEGHVLGGGVEGSPSLDSHVSSAVPIDGPDPDSVPDDGWRGSGALLEGTNGELYVYQACATGPRPAYRSAKAQVAPIDQRTVTVRCKRDEHVSGGGAYVSGPADDTHMAASRPIDGGDLDQVPDDGWRATVSNDGAVFQTAAVKAICVD